MPPHNLLQLLSPKPPQIDIQSKQKHGACFANAASSQLTFTPSIRWPPVRPSIMNF